MSKKINAKFIYLTIDSTERAKNLCTTLISEELVACANILGASSSIYKWEGRIVAEDEVVIILKTRNNLVKLVIERIKELHPYDCPAVVVLKLEDGNNDFFEWIDETTLSPG